MKRENFITEIKDNLFRVNDKWYDKSAFNHLQEVVINDKPLLMEYYQRLTTSNDSDFLDGFSIWIYGNDRQGFTPHIHFILGEPSKPRINIEIHLTNFEVYHMEAPKNQDISWENLPSSLKNKFMCWLELLNDEEANTTNADNLFKYWDGNNPDNTLEKFVKNHQLQDKIHPLLKKYLYGETINTDFLIKEIFGKVLPLYQSDKEIREKLHRLVDSPMDFVKETNIDVKLTPYNMTKKF